ncbi:hypothetical protein WN51_03006 [Melipona quadrifasciata]|uniref:Uncharacterized protein n=1 Tax=Melipona quadrifasciata TaxID=166423 RepID=A0A0N0BEG6_9HYME|nr:hypothetical protein WN51_03006 [Melipona quadrifasciata]
MLLTSLLLPIKLLRNRSQEVFHNSISLWPKYRTGEEGSTWVTESTSLTALSLSTLTTPIVVDSIARAQSSRDNGRFVLWQLSAVVLELVGDNGRG